MIGSYANFAAATAAANTTTTTTTAFHAIGQFHDEKLTRPRDLTSRMGQRMEEPATRLEVDDGDGDDDCQPLDFSVKRKSSSSYHRESGEYDVCLNCVLFRV